MITIIIETRLFLQQCNLRPLFPQQLTWRLLVRRFHDTCVGVARRRHRHTTTETSASW
ncbi:hypothetical protein [Nostoc sp.]|uniref:hypothetical protein n=1 Tax=Nostoc sp. TaxID=1180 RepID=UPI002FF9DA3D